MKKLTLLTALITACFLTLFLLNDGFAAPPAKPKAPLTPAGTATPQTTPAANQQSAVPGSLKIRKAEMTNLVIGTAADGTWTWKATVKNTGTAALNGKDLTVQGSSISFPPAQNTWKPASGSIVSSGTLAPNQSVEVLRHWTRCCLTDQLKVELRDTVANKVLDTKLLAGLIYSAAPMKPLDVRVKRIEWDDSAKTWKATVKNNTNFTLKFSVQGYLWPAGTNSPVPAGGQQLTLGPQAEKTAMALHATGAKNGDLLKVHIHFLMGAGACNENWEDCGGRGSHNITIPNSANF
ncbi:MAG: hypothetical protein EHM45_13720 [Desulfobacteraceae bacterium]|nr:MAG: hypothetical protein EHM45_13720 [Desulfobacteraceae bacterium]